MERTWSVRRRWAPRRGSGPRAPSRGDRLAPAAGLPCEPRPSELSWRLHPGHGAPPQHPSGPTAPIPSFSTASGDRRTRSPCGAPCAVRRILIPEPRNAGGIIRPGPPGRPRFSPIPGGRPPNVSGRTPVSERFAGSRIDQTVRRDPSGLPRKPKSMARRKDASVVRIVRYCVRVPDLPDVNVWETGWSS